MPIRPSDPVEQDPDNQRTLDLGIDEQVGSKAFHVWTWTEASGTGCGDNYPHLYQG